MLKDSYEIFIKRFINDERTFIDWAISETIFFDENDSNFLEQWRYIIDALQISDNGEEHKIYIRKNGNNGRNSDILKDIYESIFKGSTEIVIDNSNNNSTHGKVDKMGAYKRWKKKIKDDNSKIVVKNYTVSHIFENTANPYLFHAPWNFCLTPSIVDPLTGHETIGNLSKGFKKEFYNVVFMKYQKYIDEYNNILMSGVQEIVCEKLLDAGFDDIVQQWKPIKREDYLL